MPAWAADAGNLVRHLTALPPNVLDAAGYRRALGQLARRHGLRLRWYSEAALSKSSLVDQSADIAGFKKITERLKKEPDFDRSKVDSIKQAIQNGQYPLNPRRIAESFVALENLISN